MKKRKLLLTTAAIVAIASPLAIGAASAPRSQAQPPANGDRPSFEVASIKPNKSGDGRVLIQNQPGGRFTATNIALRELIRIAYGVQNFQLIGGPDWLASEHFDIVAKAADDLPPSPPLSQPGVVGPMLMMIQTLLADRFKLVVHNEMRELPIYALVLARSDGKLGPSLHKSDVDCAALQGRGRGRGPGGPPPGPPQPGERPKCGMFSGLGNFAGGSVTMMQLASALANRVNRVVVDRTGLAGNFDVDLAFTPDQLPSGPPPPGAPPLPAIDPNGPSIFTALQEQLGLKLDSQKGPVDVVVIDSAESLTPD